MRVASKRRFRTVWTKRVGKGILLLWRGKQSHLRRGDHGHSPSVRFTPSNQTALPNH